MFHVVSTKRMCMGVVFPRHSKSASSLVDAKRKKGAYGDCTRRASHWAKSMQYCVFVAPNGPQRPEPPEVAASRGPSCVCRVIPLRSQTNKPKGDTNLDIHLSIIGRMKAMSPPPPVAPRPNCNTVVHIASRVPFSTARSSLLPRPPRLQPPVNQTSSRHSLNPAGIFHFHQESGHVSVVAPL